LPTTIALSFSSIPSACHISLLECRAVCDKKLAIRRVWIAVQPELVEPTMDSDAVVNEQPSDEAVAVGSFGYDERDDDDLGLDTGMQPSTSHTPTLLQSMLFGVATSSARWDG
jgi:hypothetical protein